MTRRALFRKSKATRGLFRSRRGSSAVEFAIVAPVFLAMTFSTFEVGWYYFVNSNLDAALVSAARYIRTGQAQAEGYTSQDDADLFLENVVCNNIRYLSADECFRKVTVEVRTFASYADLANDHSNFVCTDNTPQDIQNLAFDPGSDRSIVRLRLCLLYKSINPAIGLDLGSGEHGERRITATYVLRVEPDASKS